MPSPASETLWFGPHRLDLRTQQLWTGSTPVPLQPKTWALLLYLLERPGLLVSTDELLNELWPQGDVTHKALTNRIVDLRKALGDDPQAPRLIQTVHRRGYRLLAEVRRGNAPAEVESPAWPALVTPAAPASVAAAADATGLAGRTAEWATLAQHAARAAQGTRQVVLLSGESGSGKTALTEAFVRAACAATAAGPLVGRGASLQQSSEREAFGPLLALVADLAEGPGHALVVPLLRRCAPTWLLQLPWLGDEAELTHWRRSLAGAGTGRMLREGCAFFELLSQQHPLLLVLEDLHWSDPATIDLLDQLAQGRRPARLMVLGTLQPALAEQARHPVLSCLRRLAAQGLLAERPLGPLTLPEVQAYLASRCRHPSQAHALASGMMRASGGRPLFLAALIEHLLATGQLRPGAQGWELSADAQGVGADWAEGLDLGAAEPLRRLLAANLAALDAPQRELLEAASVVGMQVSAQALAAALQWPVDAVEQACGELVLRLSWLLPRPAAAWPDGSLGGAWTFVHDSHRQVLYEAIAPVRRQLLHRRVAERLAEGWQAGRGAQAGALAAAFERADMPEPTARMLEQVAGLCVQRYAYAEAADALQAALAQLSRLPRSDERDRHELRLQLNYADLLMAHRGLNFPRILRAFQRAEALGLRLGEQRALLRARLGLCLHHILCAWADAAVAASEGLVALAEAQHVEQRATAHAYTGLAQLLAGHAGRALAHFTQALALPPGPSAMPLLNIRALAGVQRVRCLLALGRQAEAAAEVDAALAQARQACVPMDLIQNLFWTADCLVPLGRREEAAALLDEMVALADAQALPHYRLAGEFCRLALAPAQRRDRARMEALLQALLTSGERWCDAKLLALLAETRQAQGDAPGARRALAQAEALLAGMPVHAGEVAQARQRLGLA